MISDYEDLRATLWSSWQWWPARQAAEAIEKLLGRIRDLEHPVYWGA